MSMGVRLFPAVHGRIADSVRDHGPALLAHLGGSFGTGKRKRVVHRTACSWISVPAVLGEEPARLPEITGGSKVGPRMTRGSTGSHQDAAVWEILKNAGIDPAPRTGPAWSLFLRSQAGTILACDFFMVGLLDGTQAHVLAVIEHAARRVRIPGATLPPTGEWTQFPLDRAGAPLGEPEDQGPDVRAGGRSGGLAVHGPRRAAVADDVAVPAHDRVRSDQQPQPVAVGFRYHAEHGC